MAGSLGASWNSKAATTRGEVRKIRMNPISLLAGAAVGGVSRCLAVGFLRDPLALFHQWALWRHLAYWVAVVPCLPYLKPFDKTRLASEAEEAVVVVVVALPLLAGAARRNLLRPPGVELA